MRSVLRANPRFVREPVDNELVLFGPDTQDCHFLNRTARELLELCDGRRTLSEIVSQIRLRYPNECHHLDEQIESALRKMLRAAIVIEGEDEHSRCT